MLRMNPAIKPMRSVSIVVVDDLQVDRHLEGSRAVLDLKRDAHLRIWPAAPDRFDARHSNLELAHRFVFPPTGPLERTAPLEIYRNPRRVGIQARSSRLWRVGVVLVVVQEAGNLPLDLRKRRHGLCAPCALSVEQGRKSSRDGVEKGAHEAT